MPTITQRQDADWRWHRTFPRNRASSGDATTMSPKYLNAISNGLFSFEQSGQQSRTVPQTPSDEIASKKDPGHWLHQQNQPRSNFWHDLIISASNQMRLRILAIRDSATIAESGQPRFLLRPQ